MFPSAQDLFLYLVEFPSAVGILLQSLGNFLHKWNLLSNDTDERKPCSYQAKNAKKKDLLLHTVIQVLLLNT